MKHKVKGLTCTFVILIALFFDPLIPCRCFAQAELSIAFPYFDNVSNSGEQKYYQINVSAGQHLFIMLDKPTSWLSSLYIRYGALPTTSTYDARDYSTYADQAVEIQNTQAGYYYIMVYSHATNGGEYTITPHNNLTLGSLNIGVPTSASLLRSGATEYYQVSTAAGQNLFIILDKATGWLSSVYIRFGALPTTSEYDDRDYSNTADQAVEVQNTQVGYYYIMIYSHATSGGNYTITPHNNSTFSSLNIGTPTAGNLTRSGDRQYYQLSATPGAHLFLILDKPSGWLDRFYVKHGNLPTSDDYDATAYSLTEQALEIPAALSGYYYVMLESAASSGGSYTLTPKTSLAQLTTDTPVSGNLAWSGDTQYYEISSPNGEHLYIDLAKESSWLSTLYIRCGMLPTGTEYDAKIDGSSALDVEIP